MKNKFLIFSLLFLSGSLIFLTYPQDSLAAISVTTNSASAGLTEAILNGETTAGGTYDEWGFNLGTASASGGSYNMATATQSGAFATPATFSTSTSGAWGNLTKGEVYYFRAYAASSTEPSISYGSEVQFMTGLEAPGNLSKVSASEEAIALSWATTTGAHTVYVEVRYAANNYPASISEGAQACLVNGTTCTVNGLECNTTYYFRAWATTTDLVGGMSTSSASYAELAVSTESCPQPSGRTYTAPTTFSDSLVINQGADTTSTREVELSLKAENVLYMAICNDDSFIGCPLEPYATTKTWQLTEGEGLKTVYVQFVSPDGLNSDVISATITLEAPAPEEEEVIEEEVVEEVAEEEEIVEEAEEVVEEEEMAEEVEEEEAVGEEEATAESLRAKIQELQIRLIELLRQLLEALQEQLAAVGRFFAALF